MKVLFIGDIDAKPGRQATAALLPDIRKRYGCDLIIANVENVSHGKGVTRKALDDIRAAGVDVFTSGNHVWDKTEVFEIFDDPNYVLLRPANVRVPTCRRSSLANRHLDSPVAENASSSPL